MRHEGIKNHICSMCGIRKTTPHELKVHMNYHTREKLWPCDQCQMVLTSVGECGGHFFLYLRIKEQHSNTITFINTNQNRKPYASHQNRAQPHQRFFLPLLWALLRKGRNAKASRNDTHRRTSPSVCDMCETFHSAHRVADTHEDAYEAGGDYPGGSSGEEDSTSCETNWWW